MQADVWAHQPCDAKAVAYRCWSVQAMVSGRCGEAAQELASQELVVLGFGPCSLELLVLILGHHLLLHRSHSSTHKQFRATRTAEKLHARLRKR